ncbi:MAG: hypothetical protein SF053_06080 [Bacteroidia bacterium]|nr:hypothetical protein [Bacteroidia bacterium]
MKNFFKRLFNTPPKEEAQPAADVLTETQILALLSSAISDLGRWTWWATSLPKVIQIEFNRTQLYFPPADDSQPPKTQIAIQFINPKSISFLTKRDHNPDGQHWFDDLHHDKLEPPTCSRDTFTFTDHAAMASMINDAKTIDTIYGYPPSIELFQTEKYTLVFWAEDYGLAVASDKIDLLTKDGDVALTQIPSLHSQWWAYWRKYWDLKNTPNALPKDFACEVTIPLKKD